MTETAQEHRAEAVELLDRLTDAELAPRVEAFYYIAWVENYLERYDESLAHIDRAIAIARSTGEGRLLIPLMLTKGYPLEMQGTAGRGGGDLRSRGRGGPPLGESPLPLLGAVRARLAALLRRRPRRRDRGLRGEPASTADRPDRRDDPVRRAADRDGRSEWPSSRPAKHERGLEAMQALGGDEIEFAVPVERCFDWEMFALAELAAGNVEAAAGSRRARRATRRRTSTSNLPAGLATRTRAAVLLHTGDAAGAAALAAESAESIAAGRRASCRPRSRAALEGAALVAARRSRRGDRGAARGRSDARSVRVAARAGLRPGASCASSAHGARCAARRRGRVGRRGPDEARARDRRPGHRSADQQGDRRRALPQREDDRVPHPQHLLQALRRLPGRRRAGDRARASTRGRQPVVSSTPAPALDADAGSGSPSSATSRS